MTCKKSPLVRQARSPSRKKYVFKRLCIAVVTVFVILFVLFLMLELMPGSPFNDEKMTETQKMMLNQK